MSRKELEKLIEDIDDEITLFKYFKDISFVYNRDDYPRSDIVDLLKIVELQQKLIEKLVKNER